MLSCRYDMTVTPENSRSYLPETEPIDIQSQMGGAHETAPFPGEV